MGSPELAETEPKKPRIWKGFPGHGIIDLQKLHSVCLPPSRSTEKEKLLSRAELRSHSLHFPGYWGRGKDSFCFPLLGFYKVKTVS